VVATPIGNLEDLTMRALRILKEVDLIAAEDTRHSRKLLHHYGVATPLTSCYDHNELAKSERILELLHQGRSVALISDAGTPAISDPGFQLVRRCREEGLPVAAVPGPSAAVAALSIAGLPVDRFIFEGFLPARAAARAAALRRLADEERTTVFYEAPHRLLKTLRAVVEELGPERHLAVARELTKLHEELFRGTAAETLAHFDAAPVKGEIVLLVAPSPAPAPSTETVPEALRRLRAETGAPMRQIVKQVAKMYGLPGSEVYRQSLMLDDEEEN
jgi:16S rRNA (cytidine1402-2'-O)-methyltransferase